MARTSHEQMADVREKGRQATHQALQRRGSSPLAAIPFVSPLGFMSALLGDMDRMVRGFGLPVPFPFRSAFGAVSRNQAALSDSMRPTWAPPLEVLTRDGEFVVRAEIPGIDKDHVNVEIDEGRAVISGERIEEHEDKGEGFYRSERSYGAFSRAVELPEGANAEEAKAMFADGVLEIVIPMAGPERAHRLEIQEGGPPEPGNGAHPEGEQLKADQQEEQEIEQQPAARKRQPARAERKRKRGR